MKKLVKFLLGFSTPNRTINYYKTFVFNLFAFGLMGILKMPVLVYHNTKIYKVGNIVINCEMKRGLLSIGKLDYKSQGLTKFANYGTIIIGDYVKIEGCTIIENYGTIEFKGYNRVADGSYCIIRDRLEIGEQSRIGFHCLIMDSDDHYTINVKDKTVHRKTKPIVIGRYNWMGNSTFIKKGTVTPDYLIVASANALLAKDYSGLEPYSVVGGSPAKLLKSGIRRIYNTNAEKQLNNYFRANDSNSFEYAEDMDIDVICQQISSEF